jgi:hypothetical protein
MAIREVHLTSQTVASERFGPFLCFGFLIFYKLNYLQPWVIAGGFFYVSKYRYCTDGGIHIKSYQSYLKIERGLSKNTVQNYSFDIERLCLFLTTNGIEVSPIQISEKLYSNYIFHSQ